MITRDADISLWGLEAVCIRVMSYCLTLWWQVVCTFVAFVCLFCIYRLHCMPDCTDISSPLTSTQDTPLCCPCNHKYILLLVPNNEFNVTRFGWWHQHLYPVKTHPLCGPLCVILCMTYCTWTIFVSTHPKVKDMPTICFSLLRTCFCVCW